MTTSKIEWTERSDWNPIRGCTRVSPGCGGPGKQGGCYAEGMAARFSKPGQWGHGFAEMRNHEPRWTGKVELQEDRVTLPLSWRKPALIFVSSTSDVFHEALSDEAIDKLFAVMALTPHHTYQVLTKRAERRRKYFATGFIMRDGIDAAMNKIAPQHWCARELQDYGGAPLKNVWLGVSAEDQQHADERIPSLLQTPAAMRFVSLEPLLGPIDIERWLDPTLAMADGTDPGLDWVIVGGESGPHARPMHSDWARSLRDQCSAAGVPFFFKQWGEWAPDDEDRYEYAGKRFHMASGIGPELARPSYNQIMARVGKQAAGSLLDGKEHKAMPAARGSRS